MATRWCIAACVLLALFASSAHANLFDEVASFVKDSQAMEAFKEKLFDEDYADVADAMKEVTLDAGSAADAAGTPVPNFPQLFEGTVLNNFNAEEIPQEEVQEQVQEEAQEEEQPAEPCDGAVEAESEEAVVDEQPQVEEQLQVEEQPQVEREMEELPLVVLQSLQAVLDAEEQTAQEQFEEEPEQPQTIMEEVSEYCARALRTCELETCAGKTISENSCSKSDSGYETACACGGTSTSSFSSPGFSGFSSSSSSSLDRPVDADGLLRSMFNRRFGPFPRPPFSVEEPETAPRRMPVMPLLSMLGALNDAARVPMRPLVSFGMPSFANDEAPRDYARPMVEVVSVDDAEEEELDEEQPTVVDVTDLLRGPDGFRAGPMSIVRSFPVRLSFFNRAAEEPQQYNAEPLQTLTEVPKPVAPAEPVYAAETFDPFKWQRSSREWRPAREEEPRRRDDLWRPMERMERMQDPPHRMLCLAVMGLVAAMLSATICCCCTRRPRADEEEVVVDVVGVDAYTPLMDTYCYEQEVAAEAEKPLMPLDFEEPIKNPLKQ